MEKSYDDNYPFKLKTRANDKLIQVLKKYNHDLTLPEDLFDAIYDWNKSQDNLVTDREKETVYTVWYNFTKEPDRFHAETFNSEIDAMIFVKKLLDDTLWGNDKYEILNTLQVELEANEYSKDPGRRFDRNIFLFDRNYGYYEVEVTWKNSSSDRKVYVNDFETAWNHLQSISKNPNASETVFMVTLKYAQDEEDFKSNIASIIKTVCFNIGCLKLKIKDGGLLRYYYEYD